MSPHATSTLPYCFFVSATAQANVSAARAALLVRAACAAIFVPDRGNCVPAAGPARPRPPGVKQHRATLVGAAVLFHFAHQRERSRDVAGRLRRRDGSDEIRLPRSASSIL
jgi:hypothetical protein